MLTDEEWEKVKKHWIAIGRIPDDNGYFHFTKDLCPIEETMMLHEEVD